MSLHTDLVLKIIHGQEAIIGPIAWEEAAKVNGLKVVDAKKDTIALEGDGVVVLEKLVLQYERLFGRASREVCRAAVKNLINDSTKASVPAILI